MARNDAVMLKEDARFIRHTRRTVTYDGSIGRIRTQSRRVECVPPGVEFNGPIVMWVSPDRQYIYFVSHNVTTNTMVYTTHNTETVKTVYSIRSL